MKSFLLRKALFHFVSKVEDFQCRGKIFPCCQEQLWELQVCYPWSPWEDAVVLWVGQWDLATPSPFFGRCFSFKGVFLRMNRFSTCWNFNLYVGNRLACDKIYLKHRNRTSAQLNGQDEGDQRGRPSQQTRLSRSPQRASAWHCRSKVWNRIEFSS